MKFVDSLKHSQDLLLPNHCFLCAAPSHQALCSDCINDLPALEQCCQRCALPLESGSLCGECQRQSPSFDYCISPFRYEGQIPSLINSFKHRGHISLGEYLAMRLYSSLCARGLNHALCGAAVVAVPLHWKGQLRRGFNQAEVIAHALGKALDLPVVRALSKKANTQHQQGLKRQQRLRNSRDVYSVSKPLVYQKVLLIDDVVTTGATIEAISALLREAGARELAVGALARTPKQRY